MNIIIRFTKFRLKLYSVLRFQSTVVVMTDQHLLDAINVGKKNLLDTISIDEPLDVIAKMDSSQHTALTNLIIFSYQTVE